MSTYYLSETIAIGDTAEDGSGRLVVTARVAKAGNVQDYLGRELGKPEQPVIKVYRPPEEVFNTDSMATFAHKLVTLGHPSGPAEFDTHGVGWIGDEVARDGDFIRVPMVVAHKKAIGAVKDGTRELSVGYLSNIEFTPGKTPSGEAYDAKMTNIVVDHVAIVDQARGGPELRIGDWRSTDENNPALDHSGGRNMADNMRKVVVDGLTIETSEQGAQVIEKLTKQLGDANTALADANTANQTALAAKDAALASKDAEIASLKASQLSDADLDARVAARADLIATAKGIHDADYAGKSDAEIKLMAVTAKIGDAEVKGKEAPYIDAYFNILAKDSSKVDSFRQATLAKDHKATVNDNGQEAYEQRTRDAWKGHKAQGA